MTYDDVTQHFGVRRCESCDAAIDHMVGGRVGNTIHWQDRKFTRPGLRRILMLIAATRLVLPGREPWRQIWAYNVWASSVARKELHITIPARLSANDRAFVRWHILTATNVPPAARLWANQEVIHGKSD